jgi:ribose transport system permease protein
MSDITIPSNVALMHRPSWGSRLRRNQGLILSILFFAVLTVAVAVVNGRAPSYFGMSMLIASATTLALVAIGQTVVVIGGGLDLSVGAVVSFTQAVMVVYLAPLGLPAEVLILACIAMGMAVGAVNGFFVSVVGLQPIIVTLSTMFTLQGLTLLALPRPGGVVPEDLMALLLDDTISGILPGPVMVIVFALIVWALIKNSPRGTAIFAAGSDRQAALLAGMPVRRAVWSSYAIAGGFYGAAGAFVAAQSGAADPVIGKTLLVSSLTAVMLGGTLLGGGRGTAIGSVFGSLTVISMVTVLLAFGVADYFSSGIEALVLLAAVVINRETGLGSESELRRLMLSLRRFGAGHALADPARVPFRFPTFATILAPHDRKFVLPAWIGLAVLVLIAAIFYGERFEALRYADRLLVLGAFLAVLVLGQGAVIMSGGFDLSMGWILTVCGILAAMMMQGSDLALAWTVPLVLLLGAMIGLGNGFLVAVVGLSPIVATLAMAGLLQTVAMYISGGTPTGDTAPLLAWIVTGKIGAMTPLSLLIFVFLIGGVLLLSASPYSRQLVSVGSNARAALLNGVNVRNVRLIAYMLSGACAALAGILLTGFLGRASLTMGDSYLLPTVAAVAVGGTLITGGRGHYIGLFGGALALTALQILLSGTSLPPAVRDITLGLAVMLAVISLREK